jgi:phosphohistidine phosphatase
MPKERETFDLILWRHADAEDGYPDSARELTGRGRHQAEAVARWLSRHLPRDYRLIVSPAARAQQTAEALNQEFETVDGIGLNARPEQVLEAAGWEQPHGVVVVVGHQPTLGHVAALLLTGQAEEWSIKKGAAWWFRRTPQGIRLLAAVPAEMV